MADDFLSVLERAMKAKEPGGGTFSGRTSDNASSSATAPINPGKPMPPVGEVDGETTSSDDPLVRPGK